MSFADEFESLPLERWQELAQHASRSRVQGALNAATPRLDDFAALLSLAAGESIEALGRKSQAITRRRFGKTIRMFAPLYLSNECVNICRYCGFSRNNDILRVTLSVEEVRREAAALRAQGFRNILLVAGEHPKFVSAGYLAECVRALRDQAPSISLEIGPMEIAEYEPIVRAGAEGLVVYQETYDRAAYAAMHVAGPKKNFDWRLETPERAYAAGFRRIGIGALYGLSNWRREALCLAAHAEYLLRHCWKAQLTISLPRLRPCAGEFQPIAPLADRELAQLLCALRLLLPDCGLVLSTREPAKLRDGLIPLGVTLISAGSHTEPGGYTGAGHERVHRTERGRIVPATPSSSEWADADPDRAATVQFEIADTRSPRQVADALRELGYDPVWKDWDAVLSS